MANTQLLLQCFDRSNYRPRKVILQRQVVVRGSEGVPSVPWTDRRVPKSSQGNAMELFRPNSSFHRDVTPPIVIESLGATVGASAAQANTLRLFRSSKACFNRSLKDSSPLLNHFRGS